MNSRSQNRCAGFTLLELLIAMLILTFISIGIYQATTRTFELRTTLMGRGEFYNEVRLGIGIIERDLTQVFTPRHLFSNEMNDATELTNFASQDRNASKFWGPFFDTRGMRAARFEGRENSLRFVSASHNRVYRDSLESVFLKVSYTIEDDNLPGAEIPNSKVLIKSEQTNAFDTENDDEPAPKRFPILRGLKKLSLRYYRKETDKWDTTWDSSRPEFQDLIPDLIEATVEIAGTGNLTHEGVYRFRPESPQAALHPSY